MPVGDDQAQHLELARDIAQRFNSLYGDTFVMPATKLPTVGARVMGLDDPDKKMSKSATGAGHAIALLDAPDVIRKKFMQATTDSNPAWISRRMGPGVANLLGIYQAFSDWTDEQMRSHFTGMRYGDLKKQVGEMVASSLRAASAALQRDHGRPRLPRWHSPGRRGARHADRKLHGRTGEIADGPVHTGRDDATSAPTAGWSGRTGMSGCYGWRSSSARWATGSTRSRSTA